MDIMGNRHDNRSKSNILSATMNKKLNFAYYITSIVLTLCFLALIILASINNQTNSLLVSILMFIVFLSTFLRNKIDTNPLKIILGLTAMAGAILILVSQVDLGMVLVGIVLLIGAIRWVMERK